MASDAGASADGADWTKEEAMAAAGGLWDEARWEATEKTEEGKVKVDLLGPLLKYATYNPRRGPFQRM